MKRVLVVLIALVISTWVLAQNNYPQGSASQSSAQQSSAPKTSTQQTSPPSGSSQQGSAQQGSGAANQPGGTTAPGAAQQGPPAKHPPQAKSQDEYKAFQTAAAITDPAAAEKAADDFAAKFPASELKVLLYRQTMNAYQNANNAEKMLEIGRKIIAIDPDDPQALISVAEVLSERSRPTDLDFNDKNAEATKLATHALETIDTDLMFAADAPPERVKSAKDWLRSTAYSVLGNLAMGKENYQVAAKNLQQAIDLNQQQPDPVNFLRLAVALDKQNKYAEALVVANKAVTLAPENTQVGTLARQERDRLKQLTGGSATPAATAPGAKPPASATQQPQQTPVPH
jgi:uncharacterized protein YdeI (BOF family)